MPRALEIVDVIVRQLERGETTALQAGTIAAAGVALVVTA
jgi:hypothetical protein